MSEKEIKKAKSVQKIEQREKLVRNIKNLESIGYDHTEIGNIIGSLKQVVSAIKTRGVEYPISLRKAITINEKLDNFISQLEQ